MQKKQKIGFIKSFFPVKGDTIGVIIRKIIFMVALLTFIGSLVALINVLLIQPQQNKNTYDDIKRIYYNQSEAEKSPYRLRKEQLNAIREVNSDIVGWINIPDTVIDYPVLMPPEDDDSFYLYRNYKKESTKFGSIFIDPTVDLENNYKNIVIHGHHMKDGSMFANLMKYSSLDFYKQSPIIKFDTIKEVADWKIISVFKINVHSDQGELFEYIQTGFASDEEFLNSVYNVRERSLIDIPVDVNENDYLISLSTCSFEFDDFRTVVVARKVRPGESTDVDVSNATVNPDPLLPQIWYDKRGGTKPNITDFDTAYKNGEINWYKPVE